MENRKTGAVDATDWACVVREVKVRLKGLQ
jgi:hypothetical protein